MIFEKFQDIHAGLFVGSNVQFFQEANLVSAKSEAHREAIVALKSQHQKAKLDD